MSNDERPNFQYEEPQSEEIDWHKELGSELSNGFFYYPLQNDPEVIKTAVTASVYKLLAGEEVFNREMNEFMEDDLKIKKDEQLEIEARELFDQIRKTLGEDVRYTYEWEEAQKQGKRAAERFQEQTPNGFSTYYDYWQLRPVKNTIRVVLDENNPNFVKLRAPFAEFGGRRGLPEQLLSREMKANKLKEQGQTSLDFLKKITNFFDADYEQVVQQMFDRELGMYFIVALNECGHTNFDKVRRAAVDMDDGKTNYSVEEMWDMMIKHGHNEAAMRETDQMLNCCFSTIITAGDAHANLVTNFWTQGKIRFNPEKMQMEGTIIPEENDIFSAALYPQLNPETNEKDLLNLRKKAQDTCDALGFLKVNRYPW